MFGVLLFSPFISGAQNRDRKDTVPSPTESNLSNLFVYTNPATDVGYTTATLHGAGGDAFVTPTLPITGYFRYSRIDIPPIFCNDIYGTRMRVTEDEVLGITNSKTFSASLSGLLPDTVYYYCAIISNKEHIAYGGESVVQTFHTSPISTTIRTSNATNIKTTEARLNAYYSSRETVTTYFEYRKYATDNNSLEWTKVGEKVYGIGNNANIYGNIGFNLKKLTPRARYQYRAVGKTTIANESKLFYGSIVSFTTSANTSSGGGTTNCALPLVYNPFTRNCQRPEPDPTPGPDPIRCSPPQVFSYWSNSCITPNTCNPPTILNPYSNLCVNPPDEDFCDRFPNDNWCNPEKGWKWVDDGWRDGDWTGGGWRDSGDKCQSGAWVNGIWTGIDCKADLKLGQTVPPPDDAIVRYQEGIEHVFARQISKNAELAKTYGYKEGMDMHKFSWDLADLFARVFGYINENGKEIRVSLPDVAAYQLRLESNKLAVYEYFSGRIIDVRKTTTFFKNASYYEYYFKK